MNFYTVPKFSLFFYFINDVLDNLNMFLCAYVSEFLEDMFLEVE